MSLGQAMIDSPTEKDILFGRNSNSWNHEGNRRFRAVVGKYQEKYHSTKSRAHKVTFVATIVNELKSSGTRFLKRDHPNKEYYEVDRKACIEKVCNSGCYFILAGVLNDVTLQRVYLQVGRAIRDKQAIAEPIISKKSQEEILHESAKSLSPGHARPVPSFVSVGGLDGELAVKNPALFEYLLVQRILAEKPTLVDAARYADAHQAKKQALDSTAQQLVAVDSLIAAIQEQQQAEKSVAACRQRRDILTSLLTTSRGPDNAALAAASNLFGAQSRGLPSLQTIRRHSAMSARPQLTPSSALLDSMLSRSSVPPASMAAVFAAKFA